MASQAKKAARADFRRRVFDRSGGRCVFGCGPAVDAHHILDRSLFPTSFEANQPDNGVALCSACHLRAETGGLAPREIRAAAGIRIPVLAPDTNALCDKWGRP